MIKKTVSVREAAQMMGVTTQAVYVALRKKMLKKNKIAERVYIDVEDVQYYIDHKYDRSRTKNSDGQKRFNSELGLYSVRNLAQIFGVLPTRIYYLLAAGKIKHYRIGSVYVLQVDDLVATMKLVRETIDGSEDVAIKVK